MTSPKEFSKVRYAYGVAAALLIGGSAFSLATGPVGAQVAQNAPAAMAPRPGAPPSFSDLVQRLQPAVVNISTRQRVPVRNRAARARALARPVRAAPASSSRPTAMSSPTTT